MVSRPSSVRSRRRSSAAAIVSREWEQQKELPMFNRSKRVAQLALGALFCAAVASSAYGHQHLAKGRTPIAKLATVCEEGQFAEVIDEHGNWGCSPAPTGSGGQSILAGNCYGYESNAFLADAFRRYAIGVSDPAFALYDEAGEMIPPPASGHQPRMLCVAETTPDGGAVTFSRGPIINNDFATCFTPDGLWLDSASCSSLGKPEDPEG
jgi:hypothetical protein